MCVRFQSRLVPPARICVTSAGNPADYELPHAFLPNPTKSAGAGKQQLGRKWMDLHNLVF